MTAWSIRKLSSVLPAEGGKVEYSASMDGNEVSFNELIGKQISMHFSGQINCLNCERKIKKSFNQGFCYPCMQSLAACDICIVRPEKCHYDAGTCRDPEWGLANCMIPHTVYLAVSSGLKVGITRSHQRLTRWVDQGASSAIPCLQVKKRLDSGMIESSLKSIFADKTNWRKMLKNEVADIDLNESKKMLLANLSGEIDFEVDDIAPIDIEYPVVEYPTKVTSLGFDKNPEITGKLMGIKGQYLILDHGVINMRKHQGYTIDFEVS